MLLTYDKMQIIRAILLAIMSTLIDQYHEVCQTQKFSCDVAQERAVQYLQQVYAALLASQAEKKHLWIKLGVKRPVKGLYLWGGVGRGKTFLMDLFYDALPIRNKLRIHFYEFMHMVHLDLRQK